MVFNRSNGIYRGVILAIAGLALTGAQQPAKQAQTATSGQEASKTANATATPPEPAQPAYRAYADRYSDACYNAQNHDTADLCAQWRAALAAEKAAKEARIATIAAIIGTVLGLATVVGLIVTIWQTHGALGEARRGNRLNLLFERRVRREARKAVEDQERALAIAKDNANATAAQVKVSEDTARHQLRAYVGIKGFKTTTILTNNGDFLKLTIEWQNTGSTPAHKVMHFIDVKAFGMGDDVGFPAPRRGSISVSAMAPQQSINVTDGRNISLDNIWNDREKAIFIAWGWIEYSDIFPESERRRTEFCSQVTAEKTPSGWQIGFRTLDQHNGMDESCMHKTCT